MSSMLTVAVISSPSSAAPTYLVIATAYASTASWLTASWERHPATPSSVTGHAVPVSPREGSDLLGVDWSVVVPALAGPGWIRLAGAIDEPLRQELGDAARRAPSPLPKAGGDDHV